MPHFATTSEKVPRPNAMSPTLVHRGILQRKCACCGTLGPTGECEQCKSRRESTTNHSSELPPIVHEALSSAGQPLDGATRAFMEPRFGHDFSHVRVHTDRKAADSTRAVHAHAYTVGRDVVFGANRFAPTTQQGRELIAHELAHTIQQRGALSTGQPIPAASTLEASAEQAGHAASSGHAWDEPLGRSPLAMARQPAPAEEEEEEEEEEIVTPMALPTGKTIRGPVPSASPRKPPKRRSSSRFEPGTFHTPVREGGQVLTEIEEALEKDRREEKEKADEKWQRDLQAAHDRLQILRGMIDPGRTGYIYNKANIMAMIAKDSVLDGQILTHYGVELPPSRFTKQKTFTNDVVEAIDKFEAEWRSPGGLATPAMSAADVKGVQERQQQQEDEAAAWEGYSYTTQSALAGAGASATRLFTDDPKKIAAGAGLGAATAGSLGAPAYAKGQQGSYSPQVEGPGPFSNPVGPWRYSGPAPTTIAPPRPAAAEPLSTTEPQVDSPLLSGGSGGGAHGQTSTQRIDVTQGGPFPVREIYDLRGKPIRQQELAIPGVPGGPDRVFIVPEPGDDPRVYVVRGGREGWFKATNRTLAQQQKRGFIASEPDSDLLSVDELRGKKVLDLAAGTEGQTVRDLRNLGIDAHGMDIALSETAKQTGYLQRADIATAIPFKGQFDVAFELYGGLAYGLGEYTGPAFKNAISQVKPGGTLYLAPLSRNAKADLEPFIKEFVARGGVVNKRSFHGEDEIWRLTLPRQSSAASKPSSANQ